jgi:DNA-binding NarL/FixJ family response regulator
MLPIIGSAPPVSNRGLELRPAGGSVGTSTLRVLVVDDFEPFRQFISRTLRNKPELRVICESSDGAEAVEQAKRWQPDLILMDIGLPTLNGLQAATQILQFSPKSKILFLSQETSLDVVREALSLGGAGYIVKSDAASELLTAVDAILRGSRYISSRFSGHDFTGAFETGSF